MYIFGLPFVLLLQKLSVGKEFSICVFLKHKSRTEMVKILDPQRSKNAFKTNQKNQIQNHEKGCQVIKTSHFFIMTSISVSTNLRTDNQFDVSNCLKTIASNIFSQNGLIQFSK